MRRKLSLLTATVLAAGVVAIGAPSPAHACHEFADDPIYNWVCGTVHNAPDPKETIQHYYDSVGRIVKGVYCTLWEDPDCP
jgi:hypothetical protein